MNGLQWLFLILALIGVCGYLSNQNLWWIALILVAGSMVNALA